MHETPVKETPMSFEPDRPPSAAPVNPLPLVVVILAAAVFLIEMVFTLAASGFIGGPEASGWRLTAIENYGFYEPLMQWMVDNQTVRAKYLFRFVTYPFLQGSFTQAIFVIVFLLALGKLVGERMGQWPILAIFFGSSIIGAIVYGIVWDTRVPLFGGYPGAYGLVGGFTLILWAQLGATGGRQIQAFALIGVLLAIQFIFGIFFGAGKNWVAEVAGFVSGFGIAFLVNPGEWQRIVARLRQRR